MNILIINHYAGSPKYGMEFRAYYLAKEWQKEGHSVRIVAGSFSHLRNSQPKPGIEIIDGIEYSWINTKTYKGNGVFRIISIFQFVLKLFLFSKRILGNFVPDIVIASSTYPLDIYPSFSIAKKNKSKLFFELHDLWPLSPMLIGGFSKYHPFIWAMQQAENFACKRCDYFVSVLGNTKHYLMEHGLKEEKFFHIPNGFSLDELDLASEDLPDEHQALITKLQNERKLIVGYAGGHAPSNALRSLVNAAKISVTNNKVSFVLVGNGIEKNELVQIAQDNNLTNLHFLPAIAKTSIPLLLSQFDILYAGGTRSILHSFGTSFNKITDYMLAEKPIIFAVDEPDSLVERVGCGIQIAAENEGELIKTIKLLSELSEEERKEMGSRGKEFALRELNYAVLAKQFINIAKQ
jgi:glycosyltransferase involved in cell wall biosynthesis